MAKKPFAIRLWAGDEYGATYERVYVRPTKSKQNKQNFVAWAIGDLLTLISEGEYHAMRHYFITEMKILNANEAYEHWMLQAEAEITQQRRFLQDYIDNYFVEPEDF
jgi:hypothetical protein